MALIEMSEYFLPVLSARIQNSEVEVMQICGTASLFNDYQYITAAHTLKAALNSEFANLGYILPGENSLKHSKIVDWQLYEEVDLALFVAAPAPSHIKKFNRNPFQLNMLAEVFTAGFPHGLDIENGIIKHRALKGYIVSSTRNYSLPKKPLIYELSFPCPPGISGAPLLFNNGIEHLVCGYVLSSTEMSMEINSYTHTEEETNSKTVYTVNNTYYFGVAIDIRELYGFLIR